MIGRRLGRPITVETEPERYRPAASEVERLLAGTALAQSLWGWKPRYSLEQGLDETIAWVREHISTGSGSSRTRPERQARALPARPRVGSADDCDAESTPVT